MIASPYPYFGGKSRIAHAVWKRFGNVRNYVEPFFGSGACLLCRPEPFAGNETVNDANGYISNFWRSVQAAPEETAKHADWPVNENDLHARHIWLVERKDDLRANLEGNPEWYDAKIAGWWVWGMAAWIGSGFCDGDGPWSIVENDGQRQLVHLSDNGQGVRRRRVHLSNNGQGVHRKLVHLGDNGRGVQRRLVHLNDGQGVQRRLVHGIYDYFAQLCDRMRRVRVCCGDWTRVCGPSVTTIHGLTGVFLDPPYAVEERDTNCYGEHDSTSIAHDVREWALAHGHEMRIALCGYDGEHVMPDDWECLAWKATGGMANQNSRGNDNSRRERIWFSPLCIKPRTHKQSELFA